MNAPLVPTDPVKPTQPSPPEEPLPNAELPPLTLREKVDLLWPLYRAHHPTGQKLPRTFPRVRVGGGARVVVKRELETWLEVDGATEGAVLQDVAERLAASLAETEGELRERAQRLPESADDIARTRARRVAPPEGGA